MLGALLQFLRSVASPRMWGSGVQTESSDNWSEYATPYRFRFEVLGDAVFEGSKSLRDLLDLADVVFVNDSPKDRRAIASEALDTLLSDELVQLEALGGNDATADELHGTAQSVLESGDRDVGARISIRPTAAGTALAEDPPDDIRRLWRLP